MCSFLPVFITKLLIKYQNKKRKKGKKEYRCEAQKLRLQIVSFIWLYLSKTNYLLNARLRWWFFSGANLFQIKNLHSGSLLGRTHTHTHTPQTRSQQRREKFWKSHCPGFNICCLSALILIKQLRLIIKKLLFSYKVIIPNNQHSNEYLEKKKKMKLTTTRSFCFS